MRKVTFTGILILMLFNISCIYSPRKDNEVGFGKINGYNCYINAVENSDSVDIVFNYFRNELEKYHALADGVKLDNLPLHPDSSGNTGVYYEIMLPLKDFTGPHRLSFTNDEHQMTRDSFFFASFSLDTTIMTVSKKDSLVLPLTGIKKTDELNIDINDTAFRSAAISRTDTALNGRLVIRQYEWKSLTCGPQMLILMRVNKIKTSKGMIAITYAVKREFILTE